MAFRRKWGAPQFIVLLATLVVFLLNFSHTLATPLAPSPAPLLGIYTTNFSVYIGDYVCGEDGLPDYVIPTSINSSCLQFTADSYRVSRLPDVDCVFLTYNELGCQLADIDLEHLYELEKGNGTVCVYGGVPDGGQWYHKSGILSCAP